MAKPNIPDAPAHEQEVVVSVDKRLVWALLLIVGLAAGLTAGLMAQRGAPSPIAAGQAGGTGPQAEGLPQEVSAEQARQQAQALGLPDSAQIVSSNIREVKDDSPILLGTPDPSTVGELPQQAKEALEQDPNAIEIQRNPDKNVADASQWESDTLAGFPDPNVSDKKYAALRLEKVTETFKGPRLAIADLNDQITFDFGRVSQETPTAHDFTIKNVGDQDLLISRVYTGCGCTTTRLGTAKLDGGGFVVGPDGTTKQPFKLAPGQSETFTAQYDPKNTDASSGAKAKYIQIYSNDKNYDQFEPGDPLSHETRFRFVIEPHPSVK